LDANDIGEVGLIGDPDIAGGIELSGLEVLAGAGEFGAFFA
jgi:hypothetical protein